MVITISELIKECKKLINRYIITSNRLLEVIGEAYGLMNILSSLVYSSEITEEDLYDNRVSYDYDYFVFAKSTKTLMAIRELLNCKNHCFSEDCFMLTRSIFENHILSRYFRDNIDVVSYEEKKQLIKDFIMVPLGVSFDHYTKVNRFKIVSKSNEFIGKEIFPGSVANSLDKGYYNLFYPFLCQYTHCNFGVATDYYGKIGYTAQKDNGNELLAYALTIFAFSKVYEGIVTVNGEEFIDRKHMKQCYDLAYDSLEFQMVLFDALIEYYNNSPMTQTQNAMQYYLGEKDINFTNQKIAKMLSALKNALIDHELSSLDVSVFQDGKFKRTYAEY